MGRAKAPARFRNLRGAPCPACLDRNALNLMGRPYVVNGLRTSFGCEVCGGTGRVTLAELVGGWPKTDPYVLAKEKKPRGSAA